MNILQQIIFIEGVDMEFLQVNIKLTNFRPQKIFI